MTRSNANFAVELRHLIRDLVLRRIAGSGVADDRELHRIRRVGKRELLGRGAPPAEAEEQRRQEPRAVLARAPERLAEQVDGAEGERQNENRGERPADNHHRSLPACETRSQGGWNEKSSVHGLAIQGDSTSSGKAGDVKALRHPGLPLRWASKNVCSA